MCDSDKLIVITGSLKEKKDALDKIISDAKNVPVYVLFYSDGCGYCRLYKPIFESYRKACKTGQAIMVMVNAATSSDLIGLMKIHGFPHTQIYRQGKLIDEISGHDPDKLAEVMQLANIQV